MHFQFKYNTRFIIPYFKLHKVSKVDVNTKVIFGFNYKRFYIFVTESKNSKIKVENFISKLIEILGNFKIEGIPDSKTGFKGPLMVL